MKVVIKNLGFKSLLYAAAFVTTVSTLAGSGTFPY
jgi:hypothetical protein